MSNKNRDPYPISDVYLLEMNAVDAATVTVGDLCERLSNDFNTGYDAIDVKEIIDHFKNIDASKKNSISFGNGADGGYSVYIAVDQKNKVRKIFADANLAEYIQHPKGTKSYLSHWWDKNDSNDQFFTKDQETDKKRRIKLFDLNTQSGLIAVGDYGGPLRMLLGVYNDDLDENGDINEHIDLNLFKKNGILQNTTPFFIVNFSYGLITKAESSSFASSVIHKETEPQQKQINYFYTELFNNLLDENCYPTKYIFEDYFAKVDEFGYDDDRNYNSDFNLRIKKDVKLSGEYLSKRLPKAIQILKKQTKIIFKDSFKKVFEIRKKQFEDFIIGIIKDIEPQELNLPTFGKKSKKKKLSEKKLEISFTKGISELYDGYKLKEDVGFSLTNIIFPVKKGSYPVYLHCYSKEEDGEEYAHVKINIEGINGCYLNKNRDGKLIVNKTIKESLHLRNAIKNKLKSVEIDKIDLRDSKSLKEIEKLKDVEKLTLTNIKFLKDWSPLSKIKKIKHLHLEDCIIDYKGSKSFFEALYKLPRLEKFSLNAYSWLREPPGHSPDLNMYAFPKNCYPKKLKDFEVIVPKIYKDKNPEFPYNQGYGSMVPDDRFMGGRILQVHNLPNFEKIKTFEKLRYYNWFSTISDPPMYREGDLCNLMKSDNTASKINKFCKNSNVKDIWVYGYDFKNASEIKNTIFASFAKKIIANTKIKINGLSEKGLKKTNA
ncbi:hypothetical protein OAI69_00730 [bacterium]|nr:hypothetical protein [bacterium]